MRAITSGASFTPGRAAAAGVGGSWCAKQMSVVVEAITVVVRNDAVDRCISGGVAALAEASPNNTFRTDGKLAVASRPAKAGDNLETTSFYVLPLAASPQLANQTWRYAFFLARRSRSSRKLSTAGVLASS